MTREDLEQRLQKIRLFAFDVDGVLTDGRITLTSSGEELKSFSDLPIRFDLGTVKRSPVVLQRDLGHPHQVYTPVFDRALWISYLPKTHAHDRRNVLWHLPQSARSCL